MDRSVRFAGFVYNSRTGLQRDGAQIHLGPQARQLLELLIDSNGGVVSKAQIASRLWPDRPPSDDSIDRCAYLLRKPLREAGFGDLIATAYGRGLSLRARIEPLDPRSEPTAAPNATLDGRILDLWRTAYELAGKRTRDGYARAQAAVSAAAELDGAAPAIWSLAADIAASRAIRGHLRPAQAAAIIEEAAARALDLSAHFAPALAALGWARATLSGRPDEGLDLVDEAVARDASYGKARAYRSWALASKDRLSDAIADAEAGLRLSPHDEALLSLRAWLEFCAGDLEASVGLARRGSELRPDGCSLLIVISIVESLSGKHDEARQAARRALEMFPDDPPLLATLAYVLARAGRIEESEAALAAAAPDDETTTPSLFGAAAMLALGRDAEARAALLQAGEAGCPWFVFAPYDPRLTSLRNEIGGLAAAER
ncbi:MAG: winged helix-turn-helix domain-containing protein [Methylocystis sp.]|jgi:DNA-binding winged helix-turn-helix (wHTH) protein